MTGVRDRNDCRGIKPRRQRGNATDVVWPTNRRLVLVDIENVVGGPCTTEACAEWAHRRVLDTVGLGRQDQVVVAVDGTFLSCVAWVWSMARTLAGYGENGADLALIEVLREDVASRFRSVVLASGDGIFTDLVAELTEHGVHVTVVAHESGLSARLREAASEVVLLSGSGGLPTQRSA